MKRLGSLFLVILVSFMLVGCSKENTNVSQDDTLNLIQDGLIAVNKDGDWGYVDEEGSIVIDLTYQGAGMFMNGVAVVVDSEGYKLINKDNESLTETYHFLYRDEETGLIWFIENEKVGLMDESGDILVDAKYNNYYNHSDSYYIESEFSEGYALVMMDGDYGFINEQGEEVVEIGVLETDPQPFSNGLAIYYDYDISKQGYINTKGEIQIPAQYDYVKAFDEFGHAIVRVRPNDTNYYNLINKDGENLLELLDDISKTPNGYLIQEGSNYYFIDEDLERYHDDDFTSVKRADWTIDGLFIADGKLIDDQATILYDSVTEFDGYIQDRDIIYTVSELGSSVEIKHQDDTYELNADSATQIVDELVVVVSLNESYGVFNLDGETIVPINYSYTILSHDGYIVVIDENDLHGLYTADGTKIFDCIYLELNIDLNP